MNFISRFFFTVQTKCELLSRLQIFTIKDRSLIYTENDDTPSHEIKSVTSDARVEIRMPLSDEHTISSQLIGIFC